MTKEVKIGLIGIAALAMLIFGINYLKGINMFQSANYYYVEYTNINGLAGSSPARQKTKGAVDFPFCFFL